MFVTTPLEASTAIVEQASNSKLIRWDVKVGLSLLFPSLFQTFHRSRQFDATLA